jgi:hypothetical protein
LQSKNPTGHGSFKKGVSGDPGARPKVGGHVREIARQHTATAIETLAAIMVDKEAPPAARVTASVAILDRGYGRPAQALDLNLARKSFTTLTRMPGWERCVPPTDMFGLGAIH